MLLLLACTAASPSAADSTPGAALDTETGASPDTSSPPDTADTAQPADTADTADTGTFPGGTFTLVAVPDTQHLALPLPEVFDETFRWIADHAAEEEIAFVLGEGDIVNDDLPEEWAVAEMAWRHLDGVVPYAVAVGNHDMSGSDTTGFNTAFPESAQSRLPGFGGDRLAGRSDDSWWTFSAGGVDWLVLSLSWSQDAAQLAWAAAIVADHPRSRVIVTTHAHLQPGGSFDSHGQALWDSVLAAAPNATLVVNGHFTSDVAERDVRLGTAGQEVVSLFANYQEEADGGMGRIRLIHVDTGAGTLRVQSYAPAYDAWLEDDANAFTLTGLELSPL